MKPEKIKDRLIITQRLYKELRSFGEDLPRHASNILEKYQRKYYDASFLEYIKENYDDIEKIASGADPIYKIAEVYKEASTDEIMVVEIFD